MTGGKVGWIVELKMGNTKLGNTVLRPFLDRARMVKWWQGWQNDKMMKVVVVVDIGGVIIIIITHRIVEIGRGYGGALKMI